MKAKNVYVHIRPCRKQPTYPVWPGARAQQHIYCFKGQIKSSKIHQNLNAGRWKTIENECKWAHKSTYDSGNHLSVYPTVQKTTYIPCLPLTARTVVHMPPQRAEKNKENQPKPRFLQMENDRKRMLPGTQVNI
jgi:hypothetical protein